MNRKEKEILDSFIKEATRAIMQDPEDFGDKDSEKAGKTQKKLTSRGLSQNDRTNETDLEVILEELARAAGPNTYIRFENQYSRKTPEFSISPIVKYRTPHGIYAYPFSRENFISLINDKSPTDAEFATEYTHFHIFKSNMSKTEILSQKEKESKSKYKTPESASNDVLEALRSFSFLIKYKKRDKKLIKSREKKEQLIQKIISEIDSAKRKIKGQKYASSIKYDLNSEFKRIIKENNFFVKNNKNSIVSIFSVRSILSKLANFVFDIVYSVYDSTAFDKRFSKKILLFRVVKQSIEMMSETLAEINETERGQYYSLLLHIVGIDGISDRGTGIIHVNEPTQFVSHDFDGSSLKIVGTYKNIFKDRRSSELYEALLDTASKKENERDLSWIFDTKKAYKKSYNVGQGNLSEKDFIKILDSDKKKNFLLYCDIAKNLNATKNVHFKLLDTFDKKFKRETKTLDHILPQHKHTIIEYIVENPYASEEILEHIIKNEKTDYRVRELIQNHRNANKETKDIAGSFGNTIKKYVGKLNSFFQ